MVEEIANVVAVEDDWITVETEIKSTCNACHANNDCGTGVVAKALTPKRETLYFQTDLPVQVGSRVRIGIAEEALLTASFYLYVAPLIIFIGAAVLFDWLFTRLGLSHELWVFAASAMTAMAGFVLLSTVLKRREQSQYRPQLLGVVLAEPQNRPAEFNAP